MAATTPAPGTASTGMVKLSCADALIHHVTVKQGIRVGFKLQVSVGPHNSCWHRGHVRVRDVR